VTPGFKPKQMRPYRVPEAFQSDVDRQIQELLDLGLIVPSLSSMASPIVCVAKKDGGVRIAVDYRYVNKFTVGDAFPMPTIQETIRSLGGTKYISTFDAKSGYHQLEVQEEHAPLTAFVTHKGLYEWIRMPFGLRNAEASFCRAVQSVLRPINDFCASYVDDMGVGSFEWCQHLNHLRQFLDVMRSAAFTLSLKKCEFAKPTVTFVGHIIGSGRQDRDPSRIADLLKVEEPKNKRDVRNF